MQPAKLQPALLSGVAIGVLTTLPVVNFVNACCCAWVIGGGILAVYLMQQNSPMPVTSGDGAVVGLMAGAFGALIGSVLSIPIHLAMGPLQIDIFDRMLANQDLPQEWRPLLEQLREGAAGGAVMGVAFVFSLLTSLFFYSIFGLLGGLLGAMMFRKELPPPPPPPPGGYSYPGGTPGQWSPPPGGPAGGQN